MALHDIAWYVNFGNGSSTGYYAVPTFPTTTTVSAGAVYRQLTTPAVNNERCFVVTTGGLTTTEPTWTVTRGALNTSGAAVLQECTGVPALCGDTTNTPAWLAYKNANVTLGAVIYDSATASIQICTISGTAGNGSTPSFSTTAGTTTVDSGTTWTSLGLASNFTTAFAYPHARLFNSLTATWGAAGNNHFVANTHAETQSTALTLPSGSATLAAPVNVLCVSSSVAPPTAVTTGATISTTGASQIAFGSMVNVYINGLAVLSGSGSSVSGISCDPTSGNGDVFFENCTFTLNNTAATSVYLMANNSFLNGYPYYRNCTFLFGSASQTIGVSSNGICATFMGCNFATSGTVPTVLFVGSARPTYFNAQDCNMSAITGTISNSSIQGGQLTFKNCSVGSGAVLSSTTEGSQQSFIKFHNVDSIGTNYRYYYSVYAGTAQSETTYVRTSGATNGATAISWNITPSGNSKQTIPFVSEDIEIWNTATGSAMTAVCYLTTNSSLTNATFWIEIEYLGSSSNPLGSTVTTRAALLGSATALTTDGSTWGGTAQTNIYRVTSPSFTPNSVGPIKMRVYVGNAATNSIYVDPNIYLSTTPTINKSYFVPGWGMVNETGAAGGSGGTPVLQSAIISGLGAL